VLVLAAVTAVLILDTAYPGGCIGREVRRRLVEKLNPPEKNERPP
jgi:hypothetical protein